MMVIEGGSWFAPETDEDRAEMAAERALLDAEESTFLTARADLHASLLRGLEDSAAGRVVDLGSFVQYADDETDTPPAVSS